MTTTTAAIQDTDTKDTAKDVERDAHVGAITENILELGTIWARYGLTVGRTALETSARSLTATASLLATLAQALETKKTEKATEGTEAKA